MNIIHGLNNMKILYITILVFIWLIPICVSADIFLNNATIIGNPANHNEVVTFVLPHSYSWEGEYWTFGYRVWLNKYQMTVFTVDYDEIGIWRGNICMNYTKDLSQANGLLINPCNITELSATLYYMPTETLNILNEIYSKVI